VSVQRQLCIAPLTNYNFPSHLITAFFTVTQLEKPTASSISRTYYSDCTVQGLLFAESTQNPPTLTVFRHTASASASQLFSSRCSARTCVSRRIAGREGHSLLQSGILYAGHLPHCSESERFEVKTLCSVERNEIESESDRILWSCENHHTLGLVRFSLDIEREISALSLSPSFSRAGPHIYIFPWTCDAPSSLGSPQPK
jgi:hypothetical protein